MYSGNSTCLLGLNGSYHHSGLQLGTGSLSLIGFSLKCLSLPPLLLSWYQGQFLCIILFPSLKIYLFVNFLPFGNSPCAKRARSHFSYYRLQCGLPFYPSATMRQVYFFFIKHAISLIPVNISRRPLLFYFVICYFICYFVFFPPVEEDYFIFDFPPCKIAFFRGH